jgi:hypothetical protein
MSRRVPEVLCPPHHNLPSNQPFLGETTVYFANGKTTVDSADKAKILQLAQQAKGITAYILQVQEYASAVGSAALNQRLSSECQRRH